MVNDNLINIRGDKNITLQDITGSTININNTDLIKHVLENAQKEYLIEVLDELDKKTIEIKRINSDGFIKLLNQIKGLVEERNISIPSYSNLGTIKNINGDIIFGNQNIVNNYYETVELTEEEKEHLNLLNNLKKQYTTKYKTKMNNELGFAIDLKLEFSKTELENSVEDKYSTEDFFEKNTGKLQKLVSNFNNKYKRLSIIGEAGSGKSILLLKLAIELLEIAISDYEFPIPIILDLATWRSDEKSFKSWLNRNLIYAFYERSITKADAIQIVESDNILLLLDGLDEVPPKDRNSCIKELSKYLYDINNSRPPDKKFPELILTSRIDEYLNIGFEVPVYTSIVIQNLQTEEVKQELHRLTGGQKGNAADLLLKQIKANPKLLELLDVCFFVHISLKLVYNTDLTNINSQNKLVEQYIASALETSSVGLKKNKKRIKFLAENLEVNNKGKTFELTDLQPNWLNSKLLYNVSLSIIIGLFSSIVAGLMQWSNNETISFLIIGIIIIVFSRLKFGSTIGALVSLFYGLILSLINFLIFKDFGYAQGMLVFGGIALFLNLNYKTKPRVKLHISPKEIQTISLRNFTIRKFLAEWYKTIIPSIKYGAFLGLILGVLAVISKIEDGVSYFMLPVYFIAGVLIGIIGLISNAGIVGFFTSLKDFGTPFQSSRKPKTYKPYQRLFAPFFFEIAKWLFIWITLTFIYFWIYEKSIPDTNSLIVATATALLLTVISNPLFLHFLLRFLLFLEGNLPLGLVNYLNSITEKTQLIDKVGGEWSFKHQIIMDKFKSEKTKN